MIYYVFIGVDKLDSLIKKDNINIKEKGKFQYFYTTSVLEQNRYLETLTFKLQWVVQEKSSKNSDRYR